VVSEVPTPFHEQVRTAEDKVMQLFAFVAEDLAVATEALLSNDADALTVLSERESIIDGLYRELEGLVNDQLEVRGPMASDLRLLLSVLRIVPELERSHDLVVHIAEHATHSLGGELSPRSRGLVQTMGDTAVEMWNQATNAWWQRDSDVADVLEERDDDLDGLHAALLAELASGKMSLPVAMEMTLVARYYERLGDHSVNITRRVLYLAGAEEGSSHLTKGTER